MQLLTIHGYRETGDFCHSVMRSWDGGSLTKEQSCSDCLLGTLNLDQSSAFSYSETFATNFSAMTSGCGKSTYEPTKPTKIALNSSAVATSLPTVARTSKYTIEDDDTCNSVCKANNVSTFALLQRNNLNAYCEDFAPAGTDLCLPESCEIYTVQQNDTCHSVVARQPHHVTITQLQAWNPNLNGLCSNMGNRWICRYASVRPEV